MLRFANAPRTHGHPTQKPLAMLAWLARTYSNPRHTVGDVFMGTGTTGVACVQHGRRFVGIERDAKYFETAVQRIGEAIAAKKKGRPSDG